jgi:hypothetical protein
MNSRHIRLRTAVAAAIALPLACFVHPAGAQTAAPATPVVMPKPNCGEKPEHPGRLASDNRKRSWRKEANAYLECFNKYVNEQRALAQRYQDAANAAIDEYNATVKEMQAAIDEAAQ